MALGRESLLTHLLLIRRDILVCSPQFPQQTITLSYGQPQLQERLGQGLALSSSLEGASKEEGSWGKM